MYVSVNKIIVSFACVYCAIWTFWQTAFVTYILVLRFIHVAARTCHSLAVWVRNAPTSECRRLGCPKTQTSMSGAVRVPLERPQAETQDQRICDCSACKFMPFCVSIYPHQQQVRFLSHPHPLLTLGFVSQRNFWQSKHL